MFERAAVFSALLVLIAFCAVSIKYRNTLDLKPLGVEVQEQIG